MKSNHVLGLVFVFILLMTFSQTLALEFDNVKDYDLETRTITVTNMFGIGRTLAKIELKSEDNVGVFDRGDGVKQLVGYFDLENYGDYNNPFQKMELFNLKSNRVLNRDVEYRYRVEAGYKDIPIYQEDYCHGEKDCSPPIIDSRREYFYDWLPLEQSKKDTLPEGNITIGIFLDVKIGDRGDWIPTLFGERIEEWAEWTEGLNVGLTHYYTFNETSGSIAADLAGVNLDNQVNITFQGTTVGFKTDGIIGGSARVNSTLAAQAGGMLVGASIEPFGTADYTYSIWINRTNAVVGSAFIFGSDGSFPPYFAFRGSGAPNECRANWGGTDSGNVECSLTSDGSQFDHIILMESNGRLKIFANGVITSVNQSQAGLDITDLLLGNYRDGDSGIDAEFDEFAVWNRSLTATEISDLYNSGAGITYKFSFNSAPTTTLISPLSQNFTTSPQALEFSANATDDNEITNITLFLNGTANVTVNGTGETNMTFNITLNLGDGFWTYYYNTSDDEGLTANTITQTITIDSTLPLVNIVYPPAELEFEKVNNIVVVNYTYSDDNIADCYYVFNYSNHSITCGTNFSIAINNQNFTIDVWANDTLGNRNNDSVTLYIGLLEVNQTFTDDVLEGSTNEFTVNVSYLSGNFSSISGRLFYNNTEYTSTKSLGTNSLVFSRNLSAQLIETLKDNVTFYWEISLSNSTGTFPFNLTISNQTVNNLAAGVCGGATTILFINYTLVDEGTQLVLNNSLHNSSIEYQALVYPLGSSSPIINISGNFSKNNNGQVCISQDFGTATYILDLTTSYGADLYSEEHHYIQNATIINSSLPQQITLFDLLDSDNTDFLINFKDSSYLLVENALINIQRQYLSEGVFKTVEIGRTDNNGNVVGHFDTNNVIYTIVVTKFGEILGIFDNQAVKCDDSVIDDCNIPLKTTATLIPLDDLEDIGNITYSTNFDKVARTITTTFISTDGLSKTVSINATNFDRFGSEVVCSQQTTDVTGTIVCTIPTSYGNATVVSSVYVDGNAIVQKIYTIDADAFAEFGYDRAVLVIIMLITIPFMAITSTVGFLIAIVIGLTMAMMLSLFDTSTVLGIGSSLVWLIIAAGILIYKISRRGTL